MGNQHLQVDAGPSPMQNCLVVPPLLKASAEVILVPLEQLDVAAGGGGVGKGQRQRSWPVDDHAVGVVLGAVAWAHELVVGLGPWDDAAKVSAHSIAGEVLDAIVCGEDVGRVAIEALQELWHRLGIVSLHPVGDGHSVAVLVTSRDTSAATRGHWWVKVPQETAKDHANRDGGSRGDHDVHQGTTLHVWHKASVLTTSRAGDLSTTESAVWLRTHANEGIGDEAAACGSTSYSQEDGTPLRTSRSHGSNN